MDVKALLETLNVPAKEARIYNLQQEEGGDELGRLREIRQLRAEITAVENVNGPTEAILLLTLENIHAYTEKNFGVARYESWLEQLLEKRERAVMAGNLLETESLDQSIARVRQGLALKRRRAFGSVEESPSDPRPNASCVKQSQRDL